MGDQQLYKRTRKGDWRRRNKMVVTVRLELGTREQGKNPL